MTEIVASPAIQRMMGLPATPENTGLTVDRSGITDATTALNSYLSALVTNGDDGYLGPGSFKTSGELAMLGSSGSGISLRGAGPRRTIIKPAANTYNGLRINLPSDPLLQKGEISGFSIASPASLPGTPNNKAAFMVDATTLLVMRNLEASGFDVGFDFINNCYNTHGYSLSVPRFGSCNVGINLREGSQSGSDMQFHSSNLFGAQHAVCIKGGGGYNFFGGQWATDSVAGTPDNRGVIQLGYDYVNQSGAAISGGVGSAAVSSCSFYGLGLEGYLGNWAVRSYQPLLGVEFLGFSILASDNTANKALGIWKGAGIGNSVVKWDSCAVGQSFFANAAVCSIAGENDGFALDEGPWSSVSGTTLNGVSQGDLWLKSLGLIAQGGTFGGNFTYGRGFYNDTGKRPVQILGRGALTYDGSVWKRCNSGTTFTAF